MNAWCARAFTTPDSDQRERDSASLVHFPGLARGEKAALVLNEKVSTNLVSRATRAFAAGAVAVAAFAPLLALAWGGCGNENQACAWLLAPPSFVDAGHPGCAAEPAGQTCDASTGRCQNVCDPTEYLLTCRTAVVSGAVAPVEALLDPITSNGVACKPVQLPGDTSPSAYTFCCQCAP